MRIKGNSQIQIGAAISYGAILISIAAALLYTPWMKDQIGDANYGLYTLVSSLVSIFLMDFGLGTSVTRFIAKYRAENDQASINDVVGCTFKLFLALDVIIAVVLTVVYFLIEWIYVGLSGEEISTLKSIYLIFATYSILAFPFAPLSGVLNAYEKFVELKLCDLFQKLFSIALIVAVLLLDHNIIALVLMNAVAGLVTITLKILIISQKRLIKPNFGIRSKRMLKEIFGFSVWVTVLALAQRMVFNLAPSILGIQSNSMEIARFAPASQLEGYFFTFASAINGLFLPSVARMDKAHSDAEFETLMLKVGRYQMIVLGLLFSGIAVVGPEFVAVWMGEEYRISGYCTILMILPSLFQYSQQLANTLITVRNMVKYQALSAVAMGLLSAGLGFIWTPRWGALGASMSICTAYFVNLILLNVIYSTKLRLNMSGFYKHVYLRYVPAIVCTVICAKVACEWIVWTGWTGVVARATVTTAVYGVLMAGTELPRIIKGKRQSTR